MAGKRGRPITVYTEELAQVILDKLATGQSLNSISQEAVKPLGSRSEEYALKIPPDGSSATISANSTLGLLRGLTTFEQFWYDLNGAATYMLEAPVSIVDSPAFASLPQYIWWNRP